MDWIHDNASGIFSYGKQAGSAVVGFGCLAYLGYVGYKYAKKRLNEYVVTKVFDEIDKRNGVDPDEVSFKPMRTHSARISFNHLGKQHHIYVPYHRNKSTSMLRKNVYLIKEGDNNEEEKILMEQKPGVPYLVSPEELGGIAIVVEDRNGKLIRRYEAAEIPSFL